MSGEIPEFVHEVVRVCVPESVVAHCDLDRVVWIRNLRLATLPVKVQCCPHHCAVTVQIPEEYDGVPVVHLPRIFESVR